MLFKQYIYIAKTNTINFIFVYLLTQISSIVLTINSVINNLARILIYTIRREMAQSGHSDKNPKNKNKKM